MTTVFKSPKGLEDSKCKKGQLSNCSPILYVPPIDLVTTKESLDKMKVKLPNGMTIFSRWNTKDCLTYVAAVLCLIEQKGLDVQCKKLAKTVDKLARTLEKSPRV